MSKQLSDEEKLFNIYSALAESVFEISDEEVREVIEIDGDNTASIRNLLLNAVQDSKAKFKPEDYEKPHQTEERLRNEEGRRRLDQYLENKNKTLRGKQFMSREITNHLQSSFTQQNNKIFANDEPGTGGASHRYTIQTADGKQVGEINFQHGPVKDVGVNGFVDDALLLILLDRLNSFNQNEFRCRENLLVVTKIEEALLWLKSRELERISRGVLGTTKQ